MVIGNGVLNLTLDKTEPLREWFRTLKTGGCLQVGDILIEREAPNSALETHNFFTQYSGFLLLSPSIQKLGLTS